MYILADILLFFGSLILLIDIAPKDLFKSHRDKVSAVSKLRREKNILDVLANDITINPETPDLNIVQDKKAFYTLKNVVTSYCKNNTSIKPNWEKIIGIGYKTLFLPGDVNKLPAFKTVYLVELPVDKKNEKLVLNDICQLKDLDDWLLAQHKTSLTYTAIIFLVFGFLLQLLATFCNK